MFVYIIGEFDVIMVNLINNGEMLVFLMILLFIKLIMSFVFINLLKIIIFEFIRFLSKLIIIIS